MCRLFGFRSVIDSQVHRSLLAADNALGVQSNEHPDGWGVAFYVDGAPHLTRSPFTALGDQLFHRLSGVVASHTVLAHVRKATQGANNVLNCHPFQHGSWVFAHNGDVQGFAALRKHMVAEVAPSLRRYILGDTDSEVIFYLLLTQLSAARPLRESRATHEVVGALKRTCEVVRRLCAEHGQAHSDPPLLTMIVTNGDTLAATQGGKELYYSTYKTRCGERDTCSSLAPECEAPSQSGYVNHLVLSSEPLLGENVWLELQPGDIIGVDANMRMRKTSIDRTSLPVV
jgi:glutamine amidotransferase